MKVIISDPVKVSCFVALFQNMKQITDYVNIICNEDKWYIQSMDSHRVSVIELFLESSWFNEYNIDNNNLTIGIHTNVMAKVISTIDKNQGILIEVEEDNVEKLYISYFTEDSSVTQKQFRIPLVDLDVDLMEIPEGMNNTIQFTLSYSSFADMSKQLLLFGESIQFDCKSDKITLSTSSDENGSMDILLNKKELVSYDFDTDTKLEFSLAILNKINAYQKMSNNISIQLSNEYPLKASVYFDPNNENSKLIYYLAPKIGDD